MLSTKKLGLTFAAIAFSCSQYVSAADIENGVVVRLNAEEQKPLMIGGKELQIKNLDISAKVKRDANGQTLAPAAGISYFQVYAVGSSNVGWEYPSQYQTTTTYDHGGSQMYVNVIQYGYGNPTSGTMNGVAKYPTSRTLCGSLSTLHFCNVGETVTGWLYIYDFSGLQNGYFTGGANSVASPYGYWSDSIYVQ